MTYNPSGRACPKLAVVMLTYNGIEHIKQFLPPLLANLPSWAEAIVVDNGGSDNTPAFMQANFPEVRVVRIEVNQGFTNGYNESLPDIEAQYYCLLSSDVEVTPQWADAPIALLDSKPEVGLVQPKVMKHSEPTHFEYSGGAGGYIDSLGYPFCRGRLFFTIEEDKAQYDDPRETFWCSGACLFIRASLWHKLGGFDNDYFFHMEDIDLSWRARNAGYQVWVTPQSKVYHVGGAVITYGSPPKVFRNYKNGLIMMVKNLPMSQLWWKLPVRLLLDGVAIIRALRVGNKDEAKAIWNAHGSFRQGFSTWMRKRRLAQKDVVAYRKEAIYPGSIVWSYFMRGKQKFSDLRWKG